MSVAVESIDADTARRFSGVDRLYGSAGASRLRASHVAVVGLGGVGSWAAEALARSAVGRLTLIDFDHIAESNTNRQIHALGDSYGKSKVDAMAERVAGINPRCDVTLVDEFVTVDNASRLIAGFDAVIDCIDQVRAKAALIAQARAKAIPVYVCGAAGGRVDPTLIRCADLALVTGDALLAGVRYRLRRDHGFEPHGARAVEFGVAAIFSPEPVAAPPGADSNAGLACAGYGSSVAVTATMGMVAAARAMESLSRGRVGTT